jgi:hypothetical protein
LRKQFPAGKKINKGLYPDVYDFYEYPQGDLLADFYK